VESLFVSTNQSDFDCSLLDRRISDKNITLSTAFEDEVTGGTLGPNRYSCNGKYPSGVDEGSSDGSSSPSESPSIFGSPSSTGSPPLTETPFLTASPSLIATSSPLGDSHTDTTPTFGPGQIAGLVGGCISAIIVIVAAIFLAKRYVKGSQWTKTQQALPERSSIDYDPPPPDYETAMREVSR
jgi:hypothetical protein